MPSLPKSVDIAPVDGSDMRPCDIVLRQLREAELDETKGIHLSRFCHGIFPTHLLFIGRVLESGCRQLLCCSLLSWLRNWGGLQSTADRTDACTDATNCDDAHLYELVIVTSIRDWSVDLNTHKISIWIDDQIMHQRYWTTSDGIEITRHFKQVLNLKPIQKSCLYYKNSTLYQYNFKMRVYKNSKMCLNKYNLDSIRIKNCAIVNSPTYPYKCICFNSCL